NAAPPAVPGDSLSRWEYLLLAIFGFILFGGPLACGQVLTGHESVLPQNTREMLARHDWLVPRMGGEPWLERPPLPDWIMAGIDLAFATSQSDRVVRIGPILMAVCVVLLVGWMAGKWFGRVTGLLSGLILGTLMVLVPITGFLVWNFELRRLRRYLWFWGGLLFLAVALAWPVVMCLQYPEILDFWKNHYLGRLYQGYIGKPFWYYLVY